MTTGHVNKTKISVCLPARYGGALCEACAHLGSVRTDSNSDVSRAAMKTTGIFRQPSVGLELKDNTEKVAPPKISAHTAATTGDWRGTTGAKTA